MSFEGVIFDVDGVLVASPHERAWREALGRAMATSWRGIAESTGYRPESFTSAVYQEQLAGKPRLSGARAALEYFGVPDAERRAEEYADLKQGLLEELIEAGEFVAFPDALRFVLALRANGARLAVASSSRNANRFLERIRVDRFADESGLREPPVPPGLTLLEMFEANVCGRDLPHGKPDPAIFLLAAEELGVRPGNSLVVEDAPSGVRAARAGGMRALGVARLEDEALLSAAGADLVVTSLDEVALPALFQGRLERVGDGQADPQRRLLPARRPGRSG